MPLRNLVILLLVAVVSVFCYHRSTRNPFATDLDQALEQIRDNYVKKVEDRLLFEGAMKGMVDQLDQYSQYIDPQMKLRLRESLDQEFGGIGIEVANDPATKRFRVHSLVPGSPAYEQGIKAGETIMKIDDRNTENMDRDDAVKVLRGRPGTEVALQIRSAEGDGAK